MVDGDPLIKMTDESRNGSQKENGMAMEAMPEGSLLLVLFLLHASSSNQTRFCILFQVFVHVLCSYQGN